MSDSSKLGKIQEYYHRLKGAIIGRDQIKPPINTFNKYAATAATALALVSTQSFWAAAGWLSTVTAVGGIAAVGTCGYKTYKEVKKNGLSRKTLILAGSTAALAFALPYMAITATGLPLIFAVGGGMSAYKAYKSAQDVLHSRVANDAFMDAKILRNKDASEPSIVQKLKAKFSSDAKPETQKSITSSVNEVNPLNEAFTNVSNEKKIVTKTAEQIANDNVQKEKQKEIRIKRSENRQNKNG